MRVTQQEMTFCQTCGKSTLHLYNADHCSHILHLFLSVFTAGLWLPVWLCLAFSAGRGEPTCTVCGNKGGSVKDAPEYTKWNRKPSRFYEWLNKH
jgi:hypothetical protein